MVGRYLRAQEFVMGMGKRLNKGTHGSQIIFTHWGSRVLNVLNFRTSVLNKPQSDYETRLIAHICGHFNKSPPTFMTKYQLNDCFIPKTELFSKY